MEITDNATQSIIPSAGIIGQSNHELPPNQPNKKIIIIVATVILSLAAIIAIIVIIVSANQKPPTKESKPEPQTAEEPSSSRTQKSPEVIKEPGLIKTLATKANHILSYGTIANDSAVRSISAPIFFTDKDVSEHYRNLSSADKMTIIATFYQNIHDPTLTAKQVETFSSESCQLLFKQKNCKQTNSNIQPEKYRTIVATKQKLDKEYQTFFGETDPKLPQQIIDVCPYFTYIKELSAYVYRVNCGQPNYKINHYYQYQYQTEEDKAYVYFASGSTMLDNSGNYALLYGDIDAEKVLYTQGNYRNYIIDKDNYANFKHYRLVFKKENKNSNNYIYKKFEEVN